MKCFTGRNIPATVLVRVGNNRPDLGTNPICNRFTGQLEEGKPLFLPCNPPMPGAFVSVHLEGANLSQLSICEAFVYTDQVSISEGSWLPDKYVKLDIITSLCSVSLTVRSELC